MMTITACIITKNHEKTLIHSLNSVKSIADEIIIMDLASSDETKKLAADFTDSVYDFTLSEDTQAARHYSQSLAAMDYIFYQSAEGELSEEERLSLLQIKDKAAVNLDLELCEIAKTPERGILRTARKLRLSGKYEAATKIFEQYLAAKPNEPEECIAACYELALCHRLLKNEDAAFSALLDSLAFDAPRAEICCEIGYHYIRQGNFRTALRWFQTAAELEFPESPWFFLPEYWGYIPNLEACVCCCYLGEYELAKQYNMRAAVSKPNSAAVKQNEIYLASVN